MTITRPEHSTISTWDALDKIAADYRALEKLAATSWNARPSDRAFIRHTAEQLAAARNQLSEGTIEQATALAVVQAAEAMFGNVRDLVRARSQA